MRKGFFKIFILSWAVMMSSSAMAGLMINSNGWGYGNNISNTDYGGGYSGWAGEIGVTASGITGIDDGSFITFCLELDEDVDWGVTYDADLNTGAITGGVGGQEPASSNFDPLSSQTAWLYNEYWIGNISLGNDSQGKQFQEAIWALEHEIDPNYVVGNSYYTDALNSGATGNYGIGVLNLFENNEHRQDVLAKSNVPIPGAVWLLGSGLLGLLGFRKKRKS